MERVSRLAFSLTCYLKNIFLVKSRTFSFLLHCKDTAFINTKHVLQHNSFLLPCFIDVNQKKVL